jgi:hypothetical protein
MILMFVDLTATEPPRPVSSRVGWIHPLIVVHRGNRGAGHGVPIRISPCVRPICCEPVDSTHPDTQGTADDRDGGDCAADSGAIAVEQIGSHWISPIPRYR